MNSSPSSPEPLFLVIGDSSDFARAAAAGIGHLFPAARVEKAGSLEEAVKVAEGAEDVLVAWLNPREADVVAAGNIVDAVGLPRWALVVFGDVAVPDDVVAVTRADENPSTVARALRLARAMHRLRCENFRCRGDLSTIGTRVVHDLRSPLGGVLTTVEVLKEVLAEEAPQRVVLLDPILESTEGLTKLIRQLSLLTKASGSKNPRQRFNMGLAFWSAFQRIEQEALALGATIVQPAAWPEVGGDQAWVEAIWQALLDNSLRHGGPKPRIEVGWTRQEEENRFWIVDPGEVPPAKRPALFTPFHLLHQPNAPRGFGLPIVRRLAELQGGKSGYEPAPAGGSCFFFTLPIEKNTGASRASLSAHAKS
jgi:signal transduction histidine kinase